MNLGGEVFPNLRGLWVSKAIEVVFRESKRRGKGKFTFHLAATTSEFKANQKTLQTIRCLISARSEYLSHQLQDQVHEVQIMTINKNNCMVLRSRVNDVAEWTLPISAEQRQVFAQAALEVISKINLAVELDVELNLIRDSRLE